MQYMTHSVWKSKKNTCQTGQSVVAYLMFRTFLFCHTMAPRGNVRNKMRLLGQAVKTSPFHGGNTGSIPVGVIAFNAYCISWMNTIEYGDLAKW